MKFLGLGSKSAEKSTSAPKPANNASYIAVCSGNANGKIIPPTVRKEFKGPEDPTMFIDPTGPARITVEGLIASTGLTEGKVNIHRVVKGTMQAEVIGEMTVSNGVLTKVSAGGVVLS